MEKSMYKIIEGYMYDCMNDSAHDPEHIIRVLFQSLNIASKRSENINFDVLIASCLLHDIGREQQFKNNEICHAEIGGIMAKGFLLKNGWHEKEAEHVNKCISSHRFRGNNIPTTIEAKILYDSDKIDVTGSLGIARTLLYKGIVGSKIYALKDGNICIGENKDDDETFFKEYNFKLKNLYDKFYTKEAFEIAEKMKVEAQQFYDNLLNQVIETYKFKKNLDKYISE
jgi:uncharacterized protein